jgi:hypothetical protein
METSSNDKDDKRSYQIGLVLTVLVALLIIFCVWYEFEPIALILSCAITALIYYGFSKKLTEFDSNNETVWTVFGATIVVISFLEETKSNNGYYLLIATMFLACLINLVVKNILYIMLMIFTFLYSASILLVRHLRKVL